MAIKDRLKSLEAASAPLAAAQWYEATAAEVTDELVIGCLLYLICCEVLKVPPPALLMQLEAQIEQVPGEQTVEQAPVMQTPVMQTVEEFLAEPSFEELLAEDAKSAEDAGSAEGAVCLALIAWDIFKQVPFFCHAPNARQTLLELSRRDLSRAREDAASWPLSRVAVLLNELLNEAHLMNHFPEPEVLARVRNFKP